MVARGQNLCIRCGKQRVIVKTKKEYINSSLVYTTITACPDRDCQKLVDSMLRKEKEAREKILKNQQLRDQRRKSTNKKK